MEWYAGRLYVAGGYTTPPTQEVFTSFCVYNEATRSWDALPDLPVGCNCASSGVIGDLLLIAGGSGEARGKLQIFDFTTGQWRMGPLVPDVCRDNVPGLVLEDKLFMPPGSFSQSQGMLIYDPQSDAWTEEPLPFDGTFGSACACVHYGRIILFHHNGSAYERAPDGSWSAYSCTHEHARDALEGPEKGWGTTRVESILLG